MDSAPQKRDVNSIGLTVALDNTELRTSLERLRSDFVFAQSLSERLATDLKAVKEQLANKTQEYECLVESVNTFLDAKAKENELPAINPEASRAFKKYGVELKQLRLTLTQIKGDVKDLALDWKRNTDRILVEVDLLVNRGPDHSLVESSTKSLDLLSEVDEAAGTPSDPQPSRADFGRDLSYSDITSGLETLGLRRKVRDLTAEVEHLKSSVSRSDDECAQCGILARVVDSFRLTTAKQTCHIKDLGQQIESARAKEHLQIQEGEVLRRELQKVRAAQQASDRMADEMRTELNKWTEANTALEGKLKASQHQQREAEAAADRVLKDHSDSISAQDRARSSLATKSNECLELKRNVAHMEEELRDGKLEVEKARKVNRDLSGKMRNLELKYESRKKELEQFNSKLNKAHEVVEKMKKDEEDLKRLNMRLGSEHAVLAAELVLLKKTLSSCTAEAHERNKRLQSLENAQSTRQAEITETEALARQAEDLRQSVHVSNLKIAALDSRCNQHECRAISAEDKLRRRDRLIKILKKQVSSSAAGHTRSRRLHNLRMSNAFALNFRLRRAAWIRRSKLRRFRKATSEEIDTLARKVNEVEARMQKQKQEHAEVIECYQRIIACFRNTDD